MEAGTISMREVESFVAWSDMGYMIPPFLACECILEIIVSESTGRYLTNG